VLKKISNKQDNIPGRVCKGKKIGCGYQLNVQRYADLPS